VEQFEADPKTRRDLAAWKEKLAAGVTKFSAVAADAKRFPKLFAWLVSSAGEDMAAGFKRAAEIYQARATQRSEILLYAALPVMVLVLGVVILTQGWLLISGALGSFATWLGV
jgi:type II secretory pathway component PulF